MKSVLLIAATLAVALTSNVAFAKLSKDKDPKPVPTPDSPKVVQFKTQAATMRGLIDGYYRGMYKQANYTVKDECLGPKTITDLTLIDTAYNSGNFSVPMAAIQIQEIVYLFIKNCEFDDAIYDLFLWSEGHDMSFNFMFQTLLKKVFQVTTVANDIAALFSGPRPAPTDYVEISKFWEQIGNAFGKLLRYATDFDPDQIKKQ